MILYFIRAILCSALLLLIYIALFEKEKTNRFNRFYLLSGIFISFIIPLITVNIHAASLPLVNPNYLSPQNIINTISYKPLVPSQAEINYSKIVFIALYFSVTTILVFRFINNLHKIFSKIITNKLVAYENAKLVLITEKLSPHSFFNFIFINKEDYENGRIEKEILYHELAHARQKHSVDVLCIELLLCIFWFNPFILFYRKAIKLNHEFLADSYAVKNSDNTSLYMHLLLAKSNQNCNQSPASQFNYLITKKRLIMITKTTSVKRALCKQAILIPLIFAAIFLFGTKSYSQVTPVSPALQEKNIKQGAGASKELLNEYDSVILSMTETKTLNNGEKAQVMNMAKCNPERMAYIYKSMSKEQQDKRNKTIGSSFIAITTAPAKKSPTTAQLETWKDSKNYGVWLDGKRMNNNELNNYQPSDITYYGESRLEKNARKNDKFNYQIELYTPAYYKAVYIKNSK